MAVNLSSAGQQRGDQLGQDARSWCWPPGGCSPRSSAPPYSGTALAPLARGRGWLAGGIRRHRPLVMLKHISRRVPRRSDMSRSSFRTTVLVAVAAVGSRRHPVSRRPGRPRRQAPPPDGRSSPGWGISCTTRSTRSGTGSGSASTRRRPPTDRARPVPVPARAGGRHVGSAGASRRDVSEGHRKRRGVHRDRPGGPGSAKNHGFYVKIIDGGRGPDQIVDAQATNGTERPPTGCFDPETDLPPGSPSRPRTPFSLVDMPSMPLGRAGRVPRCPVPSAGIGRDHDLALVGVLAGVVGLRGCGLLAAVGGLILVIPDYTLIALLAFAWRSLRRPRT